MRNGRLDLAMCVLVLAGSTACGDSRPPVSPLRVPVPTQLIALTPTAMVAVAGSQVAPAPMVRVLDSRGAPMPNVSVTFELASGEGSIVGPTVTSNGEGEVRAGTWTLGTRVGSSVLRARLSAKPSIAVDFTAMTHAGPPASIVRVRGDAQRGQVGGALPESLSVKVVDRFDNPVTGIEVTFSVVAGGGTIGPAATTNGGGVASPGRWTLGPAVTEQRVVASVATALVEFSAIAYETCTSPCTVQGSLVFVRDGDIYVANADGTGERKLTSGGRNEFPAWSPDGQRIAFSRSLPGGATGGCCISDIYIMNADGSNVVRRTIGANLRWATWSPDGRTFAVTYGDWYHAEIHLLSVEDDGLPPRIFSYAGRSPQWSPDGQRIVYVTTSWDDGYHQVFVANVDGTGHRELTVFVAGAINGAAWSPSGDRIAYPQCLDGICNLYVVNADGSGTRQIAANADHAAWSPDGLWIAFTHGDVRVVSPSGDGQRLLIANAYSATWRP